RRRESRGKTESIHVNTSPRTEKRARAKRHGWLETPIDPKSSDHASNSPEFRRMHHQSKAIDSR
ncbi:MAG: hypothetical protein KDA54_06005, partial [Phycisphaerales bacterium]|nr:hypothetical protein [Phycisphaerales bacterium]